jgi:hypothetical protein
MSRTKRSFLILATLKFGGSIGQNACSQKVGEEGKLSNQDFFRLIVRWWGLKSRFARAAISKMCGKSLENCALEL